MNSNNPTTTAKSSEPPESEQNEPRSARLVPVLAVIVVTVAAFYPALFSQFVNWDDDHTLYNNPYYRGLGWSQIRWMFTTFLMGPYQPLSWMSFGMDYLVWGMNPFGYHLTNIVLHTANAVVFYFVSRELLAQAGSPDVSLRSWQLDMGAAFAALLFAIHPLRVESVAWATERRDVLSGLFFLVTIYCYLRAASSQQRISGRRWWNAALVAYVLSLLSKATGVTLPAVLLLLDVYPLRRLPGAIASWRKPDARYIVWEKVPFAALSLVFAALAFVGQQSAGTVLRVGESDIVSRIGLPFYGLIFYVWKTVLPLRLSPLYEFPYDPAPLLPLFAVSAVGVVAMTAACYLLRKRWPALFASWLYYGIMLLPVLGIVQIGPQLVADRYSYLSCLGWAVLLPGAIFCYWLPSPEGSSYRRLRAWTAPAALGLTVLVLTVLTWRQAGVWRDSLTLWQHVLALEPASSLAYFHRAYALEDDGRTAEALESYRRSASLNPARAMSHHNIARLLAQKGEYEQAMPHYARALELDPNNAKSHYGLGSLMGMRGDGAQARQHLERAVHLKPDFAEAHSNLGNVLIMQGNAQDAILHYRKSLEIDPKAQETRYNLGMTLLQTGDFTGAAEQFRALVEQRPNHAEARFWLGNSLAAAHRFTEAIAEFRETVRLNPNFADGHVALARALATTGGVQEATEHYQRAVSLLRTQAREKSDAAGAKSQAGAHPGANLPAGKPERHPGAATPLDK